MLDNILDAFASTNPVIVTDYADAKSILADLNVLRAELNLKPIAGVKESKQALFAKLSAAAAELNKRRAFEAPAEEIAAQQPRQEVKERQEAAEPAAPSAPASDSAPKAAGDAAATKKRKRKAKPTGETFAAQCARLNIDPKIARAKLRRAGYAAPHFLDAERTAILTGDRRKKS